MPERPHTVLVVDDHEDGREMVCEWLRLAGYHVVSASNGREALDEFDRSAPHLVLLDLHMPVMSGFEVIDELGASGRLRSTQVIVCSATAEDAPEGFRRMAKPFDPANMLRAVADMCSEGAPSSH